MSSNKKPIIEDLKVSDVPVKNKKLDEINEMLSEYKINIYDHLPKRDAKSVSFILNGTSSFANFIRAILWDGVLVWSLKVETLSIQSSDPFMLFDDLEQKIHGIPINQTFLNNAYEKDSDAMYKKFKGSFVVFNNTTQLRTITTADMKFTYDNKPIDYMCSDIPIFRLQPGKQLSLEMTIERGYGYDDGNKFNSLNSRKYKILDEKHVSEGGKSSLEYNPMRFEIGYTTYRNYDNPLEPLNIVIDDNIRRLNGLLGKIKIFNESKLSILHDDEVNFMRYETQTHYYNNETYFLSGAIARMIYEQDHNIELVTFDSKHLLENNSFIVVQSDVADEKMKKACEAIIDDLNEIKKIIGY